MGQEKNPRSPWVILGCASWLAFASFVPVYSIPPIEHIIREELALSHAQMGLLLSFLLIMIAVIVIPGGFLADRIGIRKVAGIGAIILTVGSLMRGFSTSFMMILAFTGLLGVGIGLIFPNLPKLVGTLFPREKVGLATSIYTVGVVFAVPLAFTITLPIVFPITNTFQGTFYIWSIPAIVATILWWILVKERPRSSVQTERVSGGNESSYSVWQNKGLWLVALLFFFLNLMWFTWAAWTPALMMMRGAPPDLAAFIASVIGWACLPGNFLLPWASYKLGLKKPFLWGSALVLALTAWGAIYIPVSLGWILTGVFGITAGGLLAMLLALPVEMVPEESVGKASGMVLSMFFIGGSVAPWAAGHIIDITGSLNLAFVVLIGAGIVMACIGFLIPETGSRARLQE